MNFLQSNEMEDVRKRLAEAENKLEVTEQKQLSESEMDFFKTPPYLHMCTSRHRCGSINKTITYESYLYKSFGGLYTNGEVDLASGIFTSGWPGSYQVTWSFWSSNHRGFTTVIVKL